MPQREIWTTYSSSGGSDGSTGRAGAQLLGAVGALVVLAILLPGPAQVFATLANHGRSGTSLADTSMLLVAAITVWLLLTWVLVVAGAAALVRLPGVVGRAARQVLRRIAPAALRHVVLTVVGASVLTGVAACGAPENQAAAAHAAQVDSGVAVEGSAVLLRSNSFGLIDVDWPAPQQAAARPANRSVQIDLDWPTAANPSQAKTPAGVTSAAPISVDWPTSGTPRKTKAHDGVVVHRGDSLWTIAARHLPAHAAAAHIETAWHQWYSTNKAVIGNDPNLILPGQILLPPNPGTGDRS